MRFEIEERSQHGWLTISRHDDRIRAETFLKDIREVCDTSFVYRLVEIKETRTICEI